MRVILRIILFPISLALTIITLLGRLICTFSGVLLTIGSIILFVISLLTLILLKQPGGALTTAIIAFAISPFGVQLLVNGVVSLLDSLNSAIKSV